MKRSECLSCRNSRNSRLQEREKGKEEVDDGNKTNTQTHTNRMTITCLSLMQFGGEARLSISDGALVLDDIMVSFSFFSLL